MTNEELRAAIARIFGEHRGAVADAARAIPMHRISLHKVLRGERAVSEKLRNRILSLDMKAKRQCIIIPGPNGYETVDAACEAIRPVLAQLMQQAQEAGWQDAYILRAIETIVTKG